MKLSEALQQSSAILLEEFTRPTVTYRLTSKDWSVHLLQLTEVVSSYQQNADKTSAVNIQIQRRTRPRLVQHHPENYGVVGVNYELLMALFGQLSETDRVAFMDALLLRVGLNTTANRINRVHFPSWDGYVSDLPLVAEVCIRTGHTAKLFQAIAKRKRPNAGLAVLLNHLEEVIALNFNVFSMEELEQIPKLLDSTSDMAEKLTWQTRRPRGGQKSETNPDYVPGYTKVAAEVVRSCDAITRECQQARYLYVKKRIQQAANVEIETDRTAVVNYLQSLGFDRLMVQSLDVAENLYRDAATVFELKSCLGHLRSFLEQLHRGAGPAIAASMGTVAPADDWGRSTSFLRQSGVITRRQEELATALYTLISDEAVHPLVAERESARMLRNMVIEYGLMFLTVLDKQGIRTCTV